MQTVRDLGPCRGRNPKCFGCPQKIYDRELKHGSIVPNTSNATVVKWQRNASATKTKDLLQDNKINIYFDYFFKLKCC